MTLLFFGLLIFLATHSVRIFAEDWRRRQISRLGERTWKGIFSLLSALGLGLTVWGFGLARAEALVLWHPPAWIRHLAALLTLPAFVLLVAAYVPGNRIKAAVRHPMVLGVALWALAHLLATGRAHDLLLFGAFLVWAAVDFGSAWRREPAPAAPGGGASRDVLVLGGGITAWALFAAFFHAWLIGVRPV